MDKQNQIHEEIRKTLQSLADKVTETLEGREKINAKASLLGIKISDIAYKFNPDSMEFFSDQEAQEVLEYLTLVHGGLVEFCRQHRMEV